MSKRFPAVTAKQVVRVLQKAGFVFYRHGKGSHEFYIREKDQKMVMVSRHARGMIKRKTLASILDAADLSIEEFIEYL